MKTKLKPFSIYVPITRLDEDERIVEGIAFANEVVAGEGGIRLKRSAMEAATTDYVQNGTVRAMHQPIAAGKPLSVEWTEKGAYLRAKIVDDQEWAKCKEGVYKGFSIGVVPQVMRGKDVEKCQWWDSSLVDIGKDKDAKFSCLRVDGIDPEQTVEVELQRASFNEYLEGTAPSDLRDMALDYLWNSLVDIQWSDGTSEEKEALVRATCDEFKEFMVGAIATGKLPPITDADDETVRAVSAPLLTRFTTLEGEHEALLQRVAQSTAQLETQTETISTLTTERDNSAGELTRVQGLLDTEVTRAKAAEERVKQLESEPARRAPVRVPEALERTFAAQRAPENAEDIAKLKKEFSELSRMQPAKNAKEQDQRSSQISLIKRQLRELGEEL